MRIYTEVNFKWDDNKGRLVEISSESFDYNGELALCDQNPPIAWWGYDDQGNRYGYREFDVPGIGRGEHKYDVIVHKRDGSSETISSYISTTHKGTVGVIKEYIDKQGTSRLDDAGNFFTTEESALKEGAQNAWIAAGSPSVDDQNAIFDEYGYYISADGEVTTEYDIADDSYTNLEGLDDPGLETNIVDYGELDLTSDVIDLREATDTALRLKLKQWEAIVDPTIYDEFQGDIESHVNDIVRAEENVKTKYDELFGAGGLLGDVEEAYKTDVEKAKTKWETDLEEYGRTKFESLQDTVTTREEGLESIREAYLGSPSQKGKLREAEAKIGAAGFAATGVGRTAREILAEDIGKEARDIEVGFEEGRGDIASDYEKDISDLAAQYKPGSGTIYEDYKTARDVSAKGKLTSWKSATETYKNLVEDFQEFKLKPIQEQAQTALSGIAQEMGSLIQTQRMGSQAGLEDPGYDPFGIIDGQGGALYGYTPEQFGLAASAQDYQFLGIGDDYLFTSPQYGATDVTHGSYNPYQQKISDDFLYDPSILTTDLFAKDFGSSLIDEKDDEDIPLGQRLK